MAGFARAVQSLAKRVWTLSQLEQERRFEEVLAALISEDIVDETTLMLDSSIIKVHQHGSGKKGAP